MWAVTANHRANETKGHENVEAARKRCCEESAGEVGQWSKRQILMEVCVVLVALNMLLKVKRLAPMGF